MKPSLAATSLPRSGIREIMELASTIPDAIHLEVGEPNFKTPEHICEAADAAASAGFTKYTPNAGIPELRDVLVGKVRERNAIEADADQIVVTAGAVAGLFSTFAALVDPGDEVLISDPAWPNYALMLQLLGIRPVRFPLDPKQGLVPTPATIEPRITPGTKALLLNSPGNPTGAVTPRETLHELIELARTHDLWVLSDEVYDEMWFDQPPTSAALRDPDERVITFFSFSKTYSMTGWRVGYLVAAPDVVEYIIKTQEPITSCVNAPAQMAAIAAITGPQDCVTEMRDAYRSRRDLVVEILEGDEIGYVRPSGAFYVMIDIRQSEMDSVSFARKLVVDLGVATVPGTAFGPDGGSFVRVSLATASDPLREGVTRLAAAIKDWGS